MKDIEVKIWLEPDPQFPYYIPSGKEYDWRRDGNTFTAQGIPDAKKKAAECMRVDIRYFNDTPESMRYLRANIWRYTGKWKRHNTVGGALYTRDYDRLGILQLQVI